ncbi:MAG TPA: hypothetical protein VN761_00135 [Candidatus Polarisedimenticolia bacterium]|nr:hypothetical protein [Candidatus Polarisedimenticolia bacterium]
MKKCTYCGQEYPDDATVCAIDQQPLVSDAPSQAEPQKESAAPKIKPPLMVRLREWHLYLGCIFAPMLLLFALTGIWQTIGIGGARWMQALSSIHTSHGLKNGGGLSTPLLRGFILVMAIAFIITIILGIIMALNQGRNRRKACYCLAFGIIFPLLAILIRLSR